ncbi:putative P-type Ca(2+) transporter [Helianthus annuus]|nr:putative P-type Ca(2+) transporter [Helianthus annuus]
MFLFLRFDQTNIFCCLGSRWFKLIRSMVVPPFCFLHQMLIKLFCICFSSLRKIIKKRCLNFRSFCSSAWSYKLGQAGSHTESILVQALRKRGHVVVVTSDGTNGAPALHEADIGLAMRIQATKLAKESSSGWVCY